MYKNIWKSIAIGSFLTVGTSIETVISNHRTDSILYPNRWSLSN